MSDDAAAVVYFPPRQHADMVVHYDCSAFHVHKLVLHHHSAYFRRRFETLSAMSAPCSSHPNTAYCIHVQREATLVSYKAVTADDFRLFLCHLYFSDHYCYPPHLPDTDVDLDEDAPPISLDFPALKSLRWDDDTPLRVDDDNHLVHNEALLTLAHGLECAAMKAQCEALLLTRIQWGRKMRSRTWTVDGCLSWLPYAVDYGLHDLRRECIQVIAADRRLAERPAFHRHCQWWSKALLVEILLAAVSRRESHDDEEEEDEEEQEEEEEEEEEEKEPTRYTVCAPTTMSTDASDTVLFPQCQYADFVIHYDSDFHVHKFVLHHHSAYFRTYFQTVPATSDSDASAAKEPKLCNHPTIAHCIHLPQQTTLAQQKVVTAADFRLFLCHLCFGSFYRYPPFRPKNDIDLTANPPLSLNFPRVSSIDWGDDDTPLLWNETDKFVDNESLMTLAHYLDCAAMMQQCEDVMLSHAKDDDNAYAAQESMTSLIPASLYQMKRWKKLCIRYIVAEHHNLADTEEYKSAERKWGPALTAEVEAAVVKHNEAKK